MEYSREELLDSNLDSNIEENHDDFIDSDGFVEELSEEDKRYTIILSDRTTIENLRMNGNNFVSKTEISESIFDGKLSIVVISDNTGWEETHHNMQLVQVVYYDESYGVEPGWYFVLRDLSEEEIFRNKVLSDIDYIAMMADVDI